MPFGADLASQVDTGRDVGGEGMRKGGIVRGRQRDVFILVREGRLAESSRAHIVFAAFRHGDNRWGPSLSPVEIGKFAVEAGTQGGCGRRDGDAGEGGRCIGMHWQDQQYTGV